MRASWFPVSLVLLCISCTSVHAEPTEDSAFQKGITAFQNDNYPQARRYFERARDQGVDQPALDYNLGVTYYRLGLYPRARNAFARLERRQDWRPLALYNLGLVARKQGDTELAKRYFRAAARSEDTRVAALANRALGKEEQQVTRQGSLFVSTEWGHDSNITLSPDSLDADTSQGDDFIQFYAHGEYPLRDHWQIAGSVFLRRFQDFTRFNDTGAEADLIRQFNPANWSTEAGVGLARIDLDGSPYQNRYRFFGNGWRNLNDSQSLYLSAEATRVDAAKAFAYLDGWQTRLSTRWYKDFEGPELSLGYRLELNDRTDLDDGNDFYSYSPVRNRVDASLTLTPGPSWRFRMGGEFEYSRYPDAHRINGVETVREDRELNVFARLDRELASRWQLYGKVEYENQASTLDTYDYDRNQIHLGVEYMVP